MSVDHVKSARMLRLSGKSLPTMETLSGNIELSGCETAIARRGSKFRPTQKTQVAKSALSGIFCNCLVFYQ
jgi:hypothetical protein